VTALPPIPRGEIIGQPNGWVPESEADHFMQCPAAAAGSTCGISDGRSSMLGRCRTRRATSRSSSVLLVEYCDGAGLERLGI
jgi:hypothetical protein